MLSKMISKEKRAGAKRRVELKAKGGASRAAKYIDELPPMKKADKHFLRGTARKAQSERRS
jgi:hypothetical protein